MENGSYGYQDKHDHWWLAYQSFRFGIEQKKLQGMYKYLENKAFLDT